MMIQLTIVLLFTTWVAAGSIDTITIVGTPKMEEVHAIYKAFGGTFDLSSSGVKELENASFPFLGRLLVSFAWPLAYISHLIFDHNITSLFPRSSSVSAIPKTTSYNLVHAKRAPIQISDVHCAVDGQYNDWSLFTVAQEEFIAGTACNAIATLHPGIYATVGVVISNAACGGFTYSGACSVVISVGAAYAGYFIQPAWQAQCTASLDAIKNQCGLSMGDAKITTTADNQLYNVDMFVTTENVGGVCIANSQAQCFATSCGANQCVPGA